MSEAVLILESVILAGTGCAAIEYYVKLRKAEKQYLRAKDAVEDIVVSFNSQFRLQDERLEHIAFKVDALASRSERALKGAEEAGKIVQALEAKVSEVLENKKEVSSRFEQVDQKIRDAVLSQEALSNDITTLRARLTQFPTIPEGKIDAVIPIRREKALAPLTETELSVLDMLASEGPKTAPTIKERIRLSREHTARLMKKLYEEGYLERNTSKIPFEYSVKEEMGKLLRKSENQTS
jgi:DNA-binding MarR family transcriptional regulator